MTAVLVLRHAQSVWNASVRWQGQADPPLSERGEEQARWAAGRVGAFDAVLSSDLRRARRTAELLTGADAIETDPRLREYDVGRWSGLTRVEIAARWPQELALFDAGQLETPPGGESRSDFDLRVAAAMAGLHDRFRGATRALVVAHGGVIRSMARQLGRTECPVRHLGGFEARLRDGSLVPETCCDLLGEPLQEDRHRPDIPSRP